MLHTRPLSRKAIQVDEPTWDEEAALPPPGQTAAGKRDKDEADISVDIMHRGLHSNLGVSAVAQCTAHCVSHAAQH